MRKLSRREFQVYMLIVERAKDNAQIAKILGCTVGVARNHKMRIMHKLGFDDSVKMLVAYHKSEMKFKEPQ